MTKQFKIHILSAFLVFMLCNMGKAQLTEYFDAYHDSWQGMRESFVVEEGRLRSAHTIARTHFYISRPYNHPDQGSWQADLKLELQFNTSSQNLVDWYLYADSSDLLGAQNAYFIRIGNTADEVCLYKRTQGNVVQKLIDGRDKLLDRSHNPLYVKIERSEQGVWYLYTNENGLSVPLFLEGEYLDTNMIENRNGYCGLHILQSTSSFFEKHFFDYMYLGPLKPDTLLPSVLQFDLVGTQTVVMEFSKPMDTLLFKEVGSFLLNNEAVLEVNQIENEWVWLHYSPGFENLQTYELRVLGLRDTSGNKLPDTTLIIRPVWPQTPTTFDLVISEIMAIPQPSNGLPPVQYAELYNRSTIPISLAGMRLQDRTRSALLGPHILEPGQFLIVCAHGSVDALLPYGNVMGVTSFPSFNTTSDDVVLLDSAGNLMHSVSYDASWYRSNAKSGGGYSLEMIDPLLPCMASHNWNASEALQGGTPGAINSVWGPNQDTTPFVLLHAMPVSENSIDLYFNKVIWPHDSASWEFILLPSKPECIKVEWLSQQIIRLHWSAPMKPNKVYTVEVLNITDCILESPVLNSTQVGLPQKPELNDLVVSEVMFHTKEGVGLQSKRYIELYNRSNKVIDLESVQLYVRNTMRTLNPMLIFPQTYVLLCHTDDIEHWGSHISKLGVNGFPSLSSVSDPIILMHKEGNRIFELRYHRDWFRNVLQQSGGYSLEMVNLDYPCIQEGNWLGSIAQNGGTPGQINSIISNDPPESVWEFFNAYPITHSLVELRFNHTPDSLLSLETLEIEVSPDLGPAYMVYAAEKKLHIALSEPMQPHVLYEFHIKGLYDCSGHKLDPLRFKVGMPETPQKGDIIINEILFHPPTGLNDFVELYHAGKKPIDLKDLLIGNLSDSGTIRSLQGLYTEGFMLYPGEYVCLSASGRDLCGLYECKNPQSIIRVSSLPSYPQRSGGVVLYTHSGQVLDSMLYTRDMHNPLISTVQGVSLERIYFSEPATMRSNWGSSVAVSGYATPGYENSIALNKKQPPKQYSQLVSSTFSPNGDGFEDRLLLEYSFDKPEFVANMYVFSKSGAFVCHAVVNQTLQSNGVLIWDGVDPIRGTLCPAGTYVMLFEVFHPNGDHIKQKHSFHLIGSY